MYCNSEWLWMENGTQMWDLSGLFTCHIVAIAYLPTASRIWRCVTANPQRDEQTGLTGILPSCATECQPSTTAAHWRYFRCIFILRNSMWIGHVFHEGIVKKNLLLFDKIFWQDLPLPSCQFQLVLILLYFLLLAWYHSRPAIRNC